MPATTTTMRAKLRIQSVTPDREPPTQETLHFMAVTGTDAFGPQGESEDNTFARYTPMATLNMTINNPNLIGQFKAGDTFYLDFTPAER